MIEIYQLISQIMENPNIKKPYKDLKKQFELIGKSNESEAFEQLIQRRFSHETNRPAPHEKQ